MQGTRKIARKPKLNDLKGAATLSPAIRDALGIPDGVLTSPYKEFSNVKRLISDYFEKQVGSVEKDAMILRNIITATLEDVSNLVVREIKNSGKEVSTKMVMINGDCILVCQASMLANYCK